jgi:hypothetical protein
MWEHNKTEWLSWDETETARGTEQPRGIFILEKHNNKTDDGCKRAPRSWTEDGGPGVLYTQSKRVLRNTLTETAKATRHLNQGPELVSADERRWQGETQEYATEQSQHKHSG